MGKGASQFLDSRAVFSEYPEGARCPSMEVHADRVSNSVRPSFSLKGKPQARVEAVLAPSVWCETGVEEDLNVFFFAKEQERGAME